MGWYWSLAQGLLSRGRLVLSKHEAEVGSPSESVTHEKICQCKPCHAQHSFGLALLWTSTGQASLGLCPADPQQHPVDNNCSSWANGVFPPPSFQTPLEQCSRDCPFWLGSLGNWGENSREKNLWEFGLVIGKMRNVNVFVSSAEEIGRYIHRWSESQIYFTTRENSKNS